MVIGITGGIGSGKSTVAGMFADLGAERIDADALGHEALERDDVRAAIREVWGPGVFDASGRIDRKALAEVAFADDEQTRRLNAIVHPPLLQQLHRRLAQATSKVAVLDAALLTESGLDEVCDVVVFVDAPRTVQRQRVAARGWSEQELQRREARQHSLGEKRERSRYVIENAGTERNTLQQVVNIWNDCTK